MKINEYKFFNEYLNDSSLKILEHGYLHAQKDWTFFNLSSPFTRLYYFVNGNTEISMNGRTVVLQPNHVYLIPLHNACDYICKDSMEMFYIHIRLEVIPGHDIFYGYHDIYDKPFDINLFNDLISSSESGSIGGLIKAKSILLSSLADFISGDEHEIIEQLKIAEKYEDVYSYIMKNCNARLRITDIADHINMPAVNLSKNFKNDNGITLKKYIESKIIQRAQEELLITDKTVKQISYELRFSDEFHFSRFFKNNTGLPPSYYRQKTNKYK